MTTQTNEPTNLTHGLEIEYNALRSEILKRIELRQQLIAITLTLAGAFLSVGLKTASVAFIFPPLASMLALSWYQNDRLIRDLGAYIREHIEPTLPGLGWQTHTLRRRMTSKLSMWRTLSHGGVFLILQLLAVWIGVANFTCTTTEWVLLSIDVLGLVGVAILIFLHQRMTK
jgi:hypothetical protein